MTRRKVKLNLIANETTRKTTFKKRKGGLLKKARELATLCDVPMCIVINSAYQLNSEVWPSREAANNVVFNWKTLPRVEQNKKMFNQETFLRQSILKATESAKKLQKGNRDLELKNLLFDCLNGRICVSRIEKSDLMEVNFVLDQYLKDAKRRAEMIKKSDESSSSSVVAAGAATTPHLTQMGEMGSFSVGFYNRIRDQIEVNLNVKHPIKDLDLNKSCDDEMD